MDPVRWAVDGLAQGQLTPEQAKAAIDQAIERGRTTADNARTVLRQAAASGALPGEVCRFLLADAASDPGTKTSASAGSLNETRIRNTAPAAASAPVTSPQLQGGQTILRSPSTGMHPEGITRLRDRDGTAHETTGPPPTVLTAPAPVPPEMPAGPLSDPHEWTGVWARDLVEGDVLNGRYKLERKLGQGGMGVVFLVRDLQDKNRPFAIKALNRDFREDPAAVPALEEEVDRGRKLAHPNIAPVYLLNRDATTLYILMQYLEGKTLDQLLDEDFARGMPFNRAEPLIQGIGAALGYAHDNGVIHSDLKPGNIFVTTAGVAKVLDFGIARAVRGNRGRFDPGELKALTAAYASCEMIEGGPPDVRDDVYGLGCVIFELLSGKHPFERRSAVEARDQQLRAPPIAGLSRRQNRALARSLAFRREDQWPSVEMFLQELRSGAHSKSGSWRRPVVLAIAAILGGSVAYVERAHFLGPDPDEQFVQSLLKPTAARSADYSPTPVQEDLDMAADYMARASKRFDGGLLSKGPSNAYDAYMSVLDVDPSNRTAAEGVVAILRAYRQEAQRLADQGQFRRAYETAATGLEINPADPGLTELRKRLEKEPGITGAPSK